MPVPPDKAVASRLGIPRLVPGNDFFGAGQRLAPRVGQARRLSYASSFLMILPSRTMVMGRPVLEWYSLVWSMPSVW